MHHSTHAIRVLRGCVLAFFFLGTVLCCLLRAQDSSTGAIHGIVSDITGSRIPMATVVIVDLAKGTRYSVVTDAEGRFSLDLLPPGDYQARATATGMSAQTTPHFRVELGAAASVEFKLAPAGTKETITVSSAPPLVDPQGSPIASVVSEREIQSLPISSDRYSDLALLNSDISRTRGD